MDVSVTGKRRRSAGSAERLSEDEEGAGTGTVQRYPFPRSAPYLRNDGAGARHGCENALRDRWSYDVTRLFRLQEIQDFLAKKDELKHLVVLTKRTDSAYLEKRNIPENYDPTGTFGFAAWKQEFMAAKDAYEHLHEDLLYTDERQIFENAIRTFEQIDEILKEIGE